jgi:hypothetical protein
MQTDTFSLEETKLACSYFPCLLIRCHPCMPTSSQLYQTVLATEKSLLSRSTEVYAQGWLRYSMRGESRTEQKSCMFLLPLIPPAATSSASETLSLADSIGCSKRNDYYGLTIMKPNLNISGNIFLQHVVQTIRFCLMCRTHIYGLSITI